LHAWLAIRNGCSKKEEEETEDEGPTDNEDKKQRKE
jgi:hypothetical protein